MVLELDMRDENDEIFPCVVQYILFPPHRKDAIRDR